jgi:hypothetical protein
MTYSYSFEMSDANINAQQTAAAANQRLMFNSNNNSDLSTSSNNPFHSDCEHPSNESYDERVKYCL